MATLLITHDMGVVAGHADRVFVMYAGREAETGSTTEIFETPRHRYTAALLDSVLRLQTERKSELATIPGRPPDLTATIAGCPFAPRCPAASGECSAQQPPVSRRGPPSLALLPPGQPGRGLPRHGGAPMTANTAADSAASTAELRCSAWST